MPSQKDHGRLAISTEPHVPAKGNHGNCIRGRFESFWILSFFWSQRGGQCACQSTTAFKFLTDSSRLYFFLHSFCHGQLGPEICTKYCSLQRIFYWHSLFSILRNSSAPAGPKRLATTAMKSNTRQIQKGSPTSQDGNAWLVKHKALA